LFSDSWVSDPDRNLLRAEAAAAPEQPQPKTTLSSEQIAKTYGLDQFGQIEAIRYTWNAEFPRKPFSFLGVGAED
jgi:hypothetical protein